MLPWIESHTIPLGPIQLQTWGTFVAAGILIGSYISARRAKAKGLDEKHIWDMLFWVIVSSFVGARLFHVLFYDLGHYLQRPWDAIDPRLPGFAMWGGFLGAAIAFILLVRIKKLDFLRYADASVWGIPWGIMIGRIGCFLIHDHPGTLSHSLLAVRYPDGQGRHDLGLYLSLSGLVMGLIFLVLNRKDRRAGFYLGTWIAVEAFTRLWLDFYRLVDVKYFGLTPTQWLTFPALTVGLYLVATKGGWSHGLKDSRESEDHD
ncbi:MAG: prolipoprotein diacylglyceryl transferase [Patescibacteria group bacterium]|nr:prolipoprotein diacylglyceryl transferase [Patescibacteria group bacterium]